MLPLTTKRRTTKNNENCQKIELYGSLTNKELKKKHSFRLVGGAQTDSLTERTPGKVADDAPGEMAAGGAGGPTFVCR